MEDLQALLKVLELVVGMIQLGKEERKGPQFQVERAELVLQEVRMGAPGKEWWRGWGGGKDDVGSPGNAGGGVELVLQEEGLVFQEAEMMQELQEEGAELVL